MKNRLLSLTLLITILALGLSSCNDDIFIKPFKISPDSGEVGPEQKVLFIKISGDDWTVTGMRYHDDAGWTIPVRDSEVIEIQTAFTEMSVYRQGDGLEIHLDSYVGREPGTLEFTVDNGYEGLEANVSVLPTGAYNLEILDVSYVLNQWSGYPDEDITRTVITYSYPEGLPEPTSFVFPKLDDMPQLCRFMPWNEDDIFAARVFNSGQPVPIPSYGPFVDKKYNGWVMAGKAAVLTTNRQEVLTPYLPPMPAAVELPAGCPLKVSLLCNYESAALDCTIKAVNPLTGTTETVAGRLRMLVPMEFASVVKL